MKSHPKKAFTLVELIIVITILAILATIGFISYQSYTNEARDGNRIATLKTIYNGITISYVQKQIYPTPDDYIDIVGVSKQGYVGDNISKSIRGEGFKDPKDNTRYLYSLDYTGKKIELSGYLENKDKIKFQSNTNLFINQAFAGNIDYTSRYIYTIGDNVGILLDSETKAPVNETISTSLDLKTNTGSYIAVFSNTGTISGSGEELLTNISIVQNSCVLGNTVVTSGQQISAYNTTSVAYNETCTPISRTCTNGVLSGDISYKYDTCLPATALNCTATTYNGYSIPAISHGITQTISKAITGGTSSIGTTCTNGALSYGTENTTCATNYTLTGNSCVANTQIVTCGGTIPTNATASTRTTYTQTWNGSIWTPTTSWGLSQSTCDFNCNTNYTWNGTSCVTTGTSSSSPGLSCLDIKTNIPSSPNGVYWIKPDTNPAFQVYCDMTTDGGGWTLVVGIGNNQNHININAVTPTNLTSISGKGKFSDTIINLIASQVGFRLECNSGTGLEKYIFLTPNCTFIANSNNNCPTYGGNHVGIGGSRISTPNHENILYRNLTTNGCADSNAWGGNGILWAK